jgi:hypothetical protein
VARGGLVDNASRRRKRAYRQRRSCQTGRPPRVRGPGALSRRSRGKGAADETRLGLKPDWGKLNVRNFREGAGNVTRGAGLRPMAKAMDKPPDPTVGASALYPAIARMVSESPGRNASEREMAPKRQPRRPSGRLLREGNMGRRRLADAAAHSGGAGSDSTVTRMHPATGETLLVPPRNRRSGAGPITRGPGKWAADERVADGPGVATRRGNARGAKGPCWPAMPRPTRKAGGA